MASSRVMKALQQICQFVANRIGTATGLKPQKIGERPRVSVNLSAEWSWVSRVIGSFSNQDFG
jgi:hypothetical protein